MKKSIFVLLAAVALVMMGCARRTSFDGSGTDDMDDTSSEESVELTADEQAMLDIAGTWEYSYVDGDGTPTTNTYEFNEDGTLVETVTGNYNGTILKFVSKGVWKVRDNIVEFLYELDKCRATVDGVQDDDFTKGLRDEDKKENLKVREYKERGETYGFSIVSVADDQLVLDVQGETITLTRK